MKSIHDVRYTRLIRALKDARKVTGLSQAELAKRLGCSRPVVSCIENGQRRVDVVELVDICQALDLDICELVQNLR